MSIDGYNCLLERKSAYAKEFKDSATYLQLQAVDIGRSYVVARILAGLVGCSRGKREVAKLLYSSSRVIKLLRLTNY